MNYFGTNFDPLSQLADVYMKNPNRNISKNDVEKEFASIFFSEILKQSLNKKNLFFGDTKEDEDNIFGSAPAYTDLFIDQLAMKLAESGKFDETALMQNFKEGIDQPSL